MIRITAPSRLHFGLFSLPGEAGITAAWPNRDGAPVLPARTFGGAGLMIERPGLVVSAKHAAQWSADGDLGGRALVLALGIAGALGIQQPLHIAVESSPPEHIGLGTGTQLALAVARAVTLAAGQAERDAVELAELTGRGKRSALGVHGFVEGGFLVEAGKRAVDGVAPLVAPLVARMPFPAEWSIVLLVPSELRGDHGAREAAAFRTLAAAPTEPRRTEALCRLVLLGMLPALAEGDLQGFGEALYDFNRRVGEMFQPWQGGLYAHPRIGELIEVIRSTGRARGVGQSSWGPAVYGVVPRGEAASLRDWLVDRRACAAEEVSVTSASKRGARVEIV
jgi:beta-RFAP synthase